MEAWSDRPVKPGNQYARLLSVSFTINCDAFFESLVYVYCDFAYFAIICSWGAVRQGRLASSLAARFSSSRFLSILEGPWVDEITGLESHTG